jgi:hypothetical protein
MKMEAAGYQESIIDLNKRDKGQELRVAEVADKFV